MPCSTDNIACANDHCHSALGGGAVPSPSPLRLSMSVERFCVCKRTAVHTLLSLNHVYAYFIETYFAYSESVYQGNIKETLGEIRKNQPK